MRRSALLSLTCVALSCACGGQPKADGAAGGHGAGAVDDGAAADGGAADGGAADGGAADGGAADGGAADGGAADGGAADGGPPDTGGGADTAPPPCDQGLEVGLIDADGAVLALTDDGELRWPAAPAQTAAAALRLRLHNPCAERLRLLGVPDAWVSGAGFAVAALPPVLLEPGADAELALAWTPGAEGPALGAFALPHDKPGSPFALTLQAEAGPPLRLLLVGEGRRVSLSEDYGLSWVVDSYETLEAHTDALQRGVCWGPPGFLAVGGSARRMAWVSPTGHAWTPTDAGVGWIGDCAYGEGIYVAAGGAGRLARSADGLSWELGGDPSGEHLRAVAYGDGVFVAVGASRRVASGDGVTIDADLSVPGTDLNRISFGRVGGRTPTFVAAGAAGAVATSVDGGRTWLEQTVTENAVQQVIYTGDEFVLADGATVWASDDGYAWALRNASGVVPLAGLGARLWGASGAALQGSVDGGFRWAEARAADGGPGFIDGVLEGAP